MSPIYFTVLLLGLLANDVLMLFVFDLQDDLKPCEDGVPLPALNISQLEFSPMKNAGMQVSGKVVFEDDYSAPIGLIMRSKRLQRGTWVEGEMSRSDFNICSKLMIPVEPWYPFFSQFSKQTCPYKKGHVEQLESAEVKDLGLRLPAEFAGDWKFYLEFTILRRGRLVRECAILPATIMEV